MDLARLELGLSLALHSFTSFLLVVLSLHLLKLAGEALDLILVLIDLGLVHVELGCHSLHLASLLLQILLVDGELLRDFGAGLPCKQVLQLDVELLFLLDGHILLDYLLSLLDEALLEGLDLQKKLKVVRVRALELAPSVVVQRVLKFLRQGLYLKPLLLEGVSEAEDLLLVLGDLRGLSLLNLELALVLANLVAKQLDVLEALVVLNLTLAERDLEDLNLLVEEGQLVISANELRTKNISFSHEGGISLPGDLMLVDGFLDEAVELEDLALLLGDDVLAKLPLLLFLPVELQLSVVLFRLDRVLVMLGGQGLVLGVDLVLELADLVLGDAELLSQLDHFIVGNDEVLTVEVTV